MVITDAGCCINWSVRWTQPVRDLIFVIRVSRFKLQVFGVVCSLQVNSVNKGCGSVFPLTLFTSTVNFTKGFRILLIVNRGHPSADTTTILPPKLWCGQ